MQVKFNADKIKSVSMNACHRRSRRAAIIAARRASGQLRSRAQLHQNEMNSIEIESSDSDQYSSDSETDIVMQHFNSMRNRPVRRPSPSDGVSYDEIMDYSDDERLGVQDFNSPNIMYPLNAYQFKYTDLMDENNYTCPHCKSILLWKVRTFFKL